MWTPSSKPFAKQREFTFEVQSRICWRIQWEKLLNQATALTVAAEPTSFLQCAKTLEPAD